ncbi:hypothetical protein DFH07DRAFT_960830 [Mycena maculata]|uniref:Uncharacterized protein n=1 Tax=Mycena maculata TaxID=230809 RepID=A0AAD7IW18_9AGAR|nr:hypothetical protein DFH07DRAFT_960830 [Mycena maculata]
MFGACSQLWQLVREVVVGSEVMTETIELHAAAIAYYEMNTGVRITNLLSHGPGGELLLSYCFANGIPGVSADKPKPATRELNTQVGKAVEKTIGIIRQMVVDGKL